MLNLQEKRPGSVAADPQAIRNISKTQTTTIDLAKQKTLLARMEAHGEL